MNEGARKMSIIVKYIRITFISLGNNQKWIFRHFVLLLSLTTNCLTDALKFKEVFEEAKKVATNRQKGNGWLLCETLILICG